MTWKQISVGHYLNANLRDNLTSGVHGRGRDLLGGIKVKHLEKSVTLGRSRGHRTVYWGRHHVPSGEPCTSQSSCFPWRGQNWPQKAKARSPQGRGCGTFASCLPCKQDFFTLPHLLFSSSNGLSAFLLEFTPQVTKAVSWGNHCSELLLSCGSQVTIAAHAL